MRKMMAVAVAALTFGAGALTAAPADAREWKRGGWQGDAPRHYGKFNNGPRYGNQGPRYGKHGPRYGRYYGGGPRYGWGYRGYSDGALAAGIIGGIAAGALIGGAAQADSGGSAYSYCAQRYRSYDPASGTYLSYDGNRYPCP